MDLKNNLLLFRKDKLIDKYVRQGKIVPFDEEFYNKMSGFYFNGIPISIHIKYLKPISKKNGKCYDRSLYMFFCFDDAFLVRGERRDLEILYGKENGGHGWIEIGDYVYDPSSLCRFEKKVYYEIYGCKNIFKCNKDTYEAIDYYNEIRNTTIEDFKPGGRKRIDLLASIPLVKGIADMSGDQGFVNELEQYLIDVGYDESTIMQDIINYVDKITAFGKGKKLKRG